MKIYFIVKPLAAYTLKKLRKSIEETFDKEKNSLYILNTLKKGNSIDVQLLKGIKQTQVS